MFILASQSPRRKELLSKIIPEFEIIPSNIDETPTEGLSPLEDVEEIAFRKGLHVHKDHFDDVVISADTIVVINNKVLGKPKDKEDAKNMLRLLSGNKHKVITAFCIFTERKVARTQVISTVIFNNLSEELINEYVETNSPLDKAGAYGVQDNEKFHIIKKVKGSITNVIGFPVDEVKKDLKKLGLIK